ncbi:MAG TPA: transcription factor TFIIIC [Methanocella sp.]
MTDNLEEKALALIKSRPRGVLQSELWKDLEIDSRKCSRVVAKLEAEGKVKRTWETVSGTRTYRLSYVETKKEAPKKEYRFDLIMAEEQVAPCVGCTYECEPDYCPDLGEWIELLAKEAIRKPSKSMIPKATEEEAAPPVREAPIAVAVPASKAKVAKKAKARPEPEDEDEEEEEQERPTRVTKRRARPESEDEDEDWEEDEDEEEEEPVRPVRKGKKVVEPEEEEEEPVKPAKKGKKPAAPEVKPVKMAKAAKKGKAAPEPVEEEEVPAKKSKPVKETKAAPKAPEAKPTKKAPAKKR